MFHPRGPTFLELARQALSSTERGYDLLAPKFDYTPYRTSDQLLAVVVERLSAQEPIGTALDLGCGTGAAARALRGLCRERVVGVDFSRGMLGVAAEHLARDGESRSAPPAHLVRGELLALPFRRAFDLAICVGTLGHVERRDEEAFVAGVARVLRPGGRLVLLTTVRPPLLARRHLRARAFNAAMRLRNLVWRPPFVMYYLGFLLPEVGDLLVRQGFEVSVEAPFGGPLGDLRLVTGRLRGGSGGARVPGGRPRVPIRD